MRQEGLVTSLPVSSHPTWSADERLAALHEIAVAALCQLEALLAAATSPDGELARRLWQHVAEPDRARTVCLDFRPLQAALEQRVMHLVANRWHRCPEDLLCRLSWPVVTLSLSSLRGMQEEYDRTLRLLTMRDAVCDLAVIHRIPASVEDLLVDLAAEALGVGADLSGLLGTDSRAEVKRVQTERIRSLAGHLKNARVRVYADLAPQLVAAISALALDQETEPVWEDRLLAQA